MIVLLPETVSRLEAQFRFRFFLSKCKTMFFKWGNMVAITDSIQANTGLFLVSSMIILLQLRLFIYCVISMNMEDTLGILFQV